MKKWHVIFQHNVNTSDIAQLSVEASNSWAATSLARAYLRYPVDWTVIGLDTAEEGG